MNIIPNPHSPFISSLNRQNVSHPTSNQACKLDEFEWNNMNIELSSGCSHYVSAAISRTSSRVYSSSKRHARSLRSLTSSSNPLVPENVSLYLSSFKDCLSSMFFWSCSKRGFWKPSPARARTDANSTDSETCSSLWEIPSDEGEDC